MIEIVKVRKVGGALVISLPSKACKELGLRHGSFVEVTRIGDRLEVRKIRLSLDTRRTV